MAELKMRVALGQFQELTDEMCIYVKQLGANDFLMNTPRLPGEHRLEYEDLKGLVDKSTGHGLRLMALENVPVHYYEKAMLGLPGRDEQIEHMSETIRNMGKAGIPILGYHWMPNKVWRTPEPAELRGGAKGTRFNMEEHPEGELTHEREYTAGEMWDNYVYYLERILPVAEEAGVTLALHPDDPPLPVVRGQPRLVYQHHMYQRLLDLHVSDHNGLEFCVGTLAEMTEGDIYDCVDAYTRFGAVKYIHLRNVRGQVPHYHETFIDEGDLDVERVFEILHKNGYEGLVIPDHAPQMVCDAPWHAGMAFAMGYLKAMLTSTAPAGSQWKSA